VNKKVNEGKIGHVKTIIAVCKAFCIKKVSDIANYFSTGPL
jgi:hypothetical protein